MIHRRWKVVLVLVGLLLSVSLTLAQPERVLTLAVPEPVATGDTFAPIIAAFEAENPEIQVQIIPVSDESLADVLQPGSDPASYLDALADYAQTADVLYIWSDLLTPAATRSGFFVDIAPLLQADTTTADALRPVTRESFAWDGAQWALPLTAAPLALLYDASAFDAAGLSYPDSDWTLDDFVLSARALTVTDSSGTVTAPGVAMGIAGAGQMLVTLNGSLTDDALPAQADFSGIDERVIDTLLALQSDGVISDDAFRDAPMVILNTGFLLARDHLIAAPLPGGTTGLTVEGFAVSAGSSDVQAAYELAVHLTNYPDVSRLVAGVPARSDATRTQISSDRAFAASEALLPLAQPASDFHFVTEAAQNLASLDSAQTRLNAYLSAIANRANERSIGVMSPPPVPEPGADTITFDFFVGRQSSASPVGAAWQQIARDFEASRNVAVNVIVSDGLRGSLAAGATRGDCFYVPGVFFAPFENLSELVQPVGPLAAADPTYRPSDFVVDAESTLSADGQLFGLPYTLQTWGIAINETRLQAAGLPVPDASWTVQELTSLITTYPADDYPALWIDGSSTQYAPLMMLFSLYAPPPVDTATSPPTLYFSNDSTQQAVQMVLDWWREGRLAYPAPGFLETDVSSDAPLTAPLVITDIAPAAFEAEGFYPGRGLRRAETPYTVLPFPVGVRAPLAYTLSGGFISADAAHPQTCYDFLSFAAQQPQYFPGMPVRGSQLDDPAFQAAQSDTLLRFYRTIAAGVNQNNRYDVPVLDSNLAYVALVRGWMNDVFAAYLQDDNVDLAAELDRLQQIGTDFLTTCPLSIDRAREMLSCARDDIGRGFTLN